MINVPQNTTLIDVAFNLSGSLTGLPLLLRQLPVGERIGFATLPALGADVADIGQTWTPDIQGMQLDLTAPTYNTSAVKKAPFTTNVSDLQPAITYGQNKLRELLNA